jgi:hypothetical protein
MSDEKPQSFEVSNLSVPTSRLEGWRKLAYQLQPSQGPGSGQLDPNTTVVNDAQWLRRFNLTLYREGPAPPPPTPTPTTNLAAPQLAPRNGSGNGSSITLDPVQVTATPLPPQSTQQPGIDLSNLRCSFNIQKTTSSSPNKLYARIYNLSPATMGKVIEFSRVQIQAGYWFSNYGLIFDGTIVQFLRGKENPVDTYLDIHAGDGDKAQVATTFTAIPAGSPIQSKYAAVYRSYKEQQPDLSQGQQDQNKIKDKTIRTQVLAGNTADYARDLYMQYNQDIYIDNGQWNVIVRSSYKPKEAVILSPKTGLVSLPEVTIQGIQARCLLNPKLVLGGLVKIDTNILSGVQYVPGTAAKTDAQGNVIGPGDPTGGFLQQGAIPNQQFETAWTAPTGLYKILFINYVGDTRGEPWYCELTCIAVDSNGTVDPKLINPRSAVGRAAAEAGFGGIQPPTTFT